jgi:hypothetical protein
LEKKMKNKFTFKKFVSLTVALAIASFFNLLTAAAFAQVTPKATGEISSVRGSVTLNGASVANGTVVFNEGRIQTGENGSATVNLGKQGLLEVGPNSEFVLSLATDSVGGNLRSGRVTANSFAGSAINVVTADGTATADSTKASSMIVDVTCGNTRVMQIANEAKVLSGRKTYSVAAGQEVSVGTPQDASRCARIAKGGAGAAAGAGIGGLSGGALAALVLLGLGGAVGGIIAATQGDSAVGSTVGLLSTFRP